jgi:cell division transport system permease protein
MGRSKLTALAAIGSLATFMFLIGLFLLAHVNLNSVAQAIRQRVQIEAFLGDEVSSQRALVLADSIASLKQVQAVSYVDKQSALDIFRGQFGDDAIQALETNPLPASLKIELRQEDRTFSRVERTAQIIKEFDGIIDVEYGRQWLSRLDNLLSMVSISAVILGLILAGCTVMLVATTIQLAFHARREAVEIMRLVGADPGFVAWPFVVEGTIYGCLGSLLGTISLGILFAAISHRLAGLRFIPAPLLIALLATGILLGGVGSLLSIRRMAVKR